MSAVEGGRGSSPDKAVPGGYPATSVVQLQPVRDAVEALMAMSMALSSVGGPCGKSRTLAYAAELLRQSLWHAVVSRDKHPPSRCVQLLKQQVGVKVTDDTIRHWCEAGKVDHERSGSGRYVVYYDSLLAFVQGRAEVIS